MKNWSIMENLPREQKCSTPPFFLMDLALNFFSLHHQPTFSIFLPTVRHVHVMCIADKSSYNYVINYQKFLSAPKEKML